MDPDRSPGGSSGGEGVLVAAGGSLIGLGNDLGGSVRNPALFSGCCGVKPTSGRVRSEGRSRDGGEGQLGSWPVGKREAGIVSTNIVDHLIDFWLTVAQWGSWNKV